ncbi:pyridoxamine 5'-phosphate oxidase family protein [Mariniblastus fucicola]|uniref:General stress protein 26 n=1 Tax=Mariniblastus fucicola TaxID=980251 RepID=A0A5B9PEW5_9BACT|nr:pyridoxamine 5'-phosphate oxidase family protein [Mariniblastus fucicola]QEG24948.1 General stress protein 26 [Mariniblastus fucicola]
MNDEQKKLTEILDNFENAMLITMGDGKLDNQPNGRPMRVAEVDDDGTVWFVTGRESSKVDEIASNSTVCITLQSGSQFVSMTGSAAEVDDRGKIDELWSEPWKVWFPEGKSDPSILLLKVTPKFGEFWDMGGLKRFRYIYEAGQAWFKGEQIDTDAIDGMNEKVEF